MNGPKIRSDVLDAYVFRRPGVDHASRETPAAQRDPSTIQLLQLRRTKDPAKGMWHPVMGHIESGERAVDALWRELGEEISLLTTDPGLLNAWALEQVHPFYLADRDEIMLSPRFAVEVGPRWEPTLNDEHDAHRWIPFAHADRSFMWPGQRRSIEELGVLVSPQQAGPPTDAALRIEIPRG